MRLQQGAKISANRELACLKNIFNRCIEWKKYEGENPVRGIRPFHESLNRVRFLTHEEEKKLLVATKEPLSTIILLGIHAGLRIKAEGLTLLWRDIDLIRRTLTVQAAHAKNKQERTVPLNSVLRNALKNLKARAEGEYVFTSRTGEPFRSIRTAFTTVCRNASLTDITPHVLRHTFASRLVMAGVDLRTVQELGGWKDLKMVMRYAHLSPAHKAEAVEKIVNYSTTLFTTSQISPAVNH